MTRNKTFVVLSTHVDATIREINPDIEFKLFQSIQQIELYIAETPIRADAMYISSETLQPTVNIALNTLCDLTSNRFFSVDKIEFICPEGFNLSPVNYITPRLPVPLLINKGPLTRDFIYAFINGSLATDDITEQRMVRVRMSKGEYLSMVTREDDQELLDSHYITDDESLVGIKEKEAAYVPVPSVTDSTEVINICGMPSLERRTFTFLFAQYLALKSKVLFIESDFQYLEMSDLVSRASLEVMEIDIDDLMSDAQKVIRTLQSTARKLIFLKCTHRADYSYNFLLNLVYINLHGYVNYIVAERNIEELSEEQEHIIVFPDTMVGCIRTIDNMRVSVKDSTRFVAVDLLSVPEFTTFNQNALPMVIRDITQTESTHEVLVFKVNSLVLGGEVHDLQMLLGDR